MTLFFRLLGSAFVAFGLANLLFIGGKDSSGEPASTLDNVVSVICAIIFLVGAVGFFVMAARAKKKEATSASTRIADILGADATSGKARVDGESLIIVRSYTDVPGATPRIRILWEGTEVGSVAYKGVFSFWIVASGNISFMSPIRSAPLRVIAGKDTHIRLTRNRFTGALIADTYHAEPAEELGGESATVTES